MKRFLVVTLVLCVLARGAASQPRPAAAASPSRSEVQSLAPLLELSRHTGADVTASSHRRDLDVETVVGLVKERLEKVAVAALSDALQRLSKGDLRPWARDLLGIAADLTTATTTEARVLVDRALRTLTRAVLADALSRSSVGWTEATSNVLADWSYWLLAQHPLLRDQQIARPQCTKQDALCNQLSQASEQALEERFHVEETFEALRMAQEIYDSLKKSPAGARRVLNLLTRVTSLGALPELATLQSLQARLERFATLRAHVEVLKQHCGALAGYTAETKAATLQEWKTALQGLLNQSVMLTTAKPVREWAALLTWRKDALARLFAPALDLSENLATSKVDAALCKDLPNLAAPPGSLQSRLAKLQSLAEKSLGDLPLADADDVESLVTKLATDLQQFNVENLMAMELDIPDLLHLLRGTGYLVKQLRALAGPAAGTLGDVHRVLRRVPLESPLFKLLAPVLTTLASGAELGRAELYRALLELAPTDLLDALHLPQEDRCANDQGGSWQCWAGRLALSVHSALSMEGETLKLEPDALVASLAKLAASERATQRGSFHLLASVGTGVLYTDGSSRPLVAEQLGGTWLVQPGERLSISAGLYASGLLYRYVLDGDVANGLIFGGTLRARLYDLLEVHADVVDAFSFRGDSGEHHLGLVFGVQVPLGDYLERSGE